MANTPAPTATPTEVFPTPTQILESQINAMHRRILQLEETEQNCINELGDVFDGTNGQDAFIATQEQLQNLRRLFEFRTQIHDFCLQHKILTRGLGHIDARLAASHNTCVVITMQERYSRLKFENNLLRETSVYAVWNEELIEKIKTYIDDSQ
ncbi:hypothetical protein BGZ97_005256 [Linnemannia gamsii]|jgi:hypothetical protein|uniref:Uncharacterized protein n=1 Tax=Linnemannia gamsii TaxID=64522 RepID=A0A9P6US94_9FUNG|nr:hypothetical protein BGZ97_005256 [Linnemannia gamsii]